MNVINVDSLHELSKAADAVISELDRHSVVAFYGSMGAGKTTLIREIGERLGVKDNVTSPTFALVNQYLTADERKIHHFDFYRINKIEEAYDFGYEEYFYSGEICFIEWPEKIEGLLPEDTLTVAIEVDEDLARIITIK